MTVDLAAAAAILLAKYGHLHYLTSTGRSMSLSELKSEIAAFGARMPKCREKGELIKTFADMDEVYETGVVVGGRDGVAVKAMACLLKAGFDVGHAKRIVGGEDQVKACLSRSDELS